MIVTFEQWEFLLQAGYFIGMTIKPSKGKDGKRTIRMDASDYKIFETNQAKAVSEEAASSTTDSKTSDPTALKVTMDASGLLIFFIHFSYIFYFYFVLIIMLFHEEITFY